MKKNISAPEESYYKRIKELNLKHYAGEVPYYSSASLRKVEEKLLSQIPSGSSILDLGCGSGRFSIGAARFDKFKVTGVDITPEAIKASRKRAVDLNLSNAKFQVQDMTELEFGPNSFDYVFCPRFVINAVSTPSRRQMAVEEMLRVVKKGGNVYIESFNKFYLGKGIFIPLKTIVTDIKRVIKMNIYKLIGKTYDDLLPGDIIYASNKVVGATEGYAHIPTILELKTMIPKGTKFKMLSIPEIIHDKSIDPLKYSRYSIWLILFKN